MNNQMSEITLLKQRRVRKECIVCGSETQRRVAVRLPFEDQPREYACCAACSVAMQTIEDQAYDDVTLGNAVTLAADGLA